MTLTKTKLKALRMIAASCSIRWSFASALRKDGLITDVRDSYRRGGWATATLTEAGAAALRAHVTGVNG